MILDTSKSSEKFVSATQATQLPPSRPPSQLRLSSMATATLSSSSVATSSSASAPDLLARRPLSANALGQSASFDTLLVVSPRSAPPDALATATGVVDVLSANNTPDPDPQILEALRSKDRLFVLKLGEMMENLINERRPRLDLTPTTSYQRLLVHRCSAYYKLAPEADNSAKTISVYFRAESRIPPRRLGELVPVEESAQPAFKIMRRSAADGSRGRHNSQAGSVTGDDPDSDPEPSEAGSLSGRSNATGSSNKRHMTLEQREAAYNEARSRIFMDFEEKEKEKEKDMSANSSTFSLVSGSGSTSGGRGSSMGDLDDSASSAATESEWSGPVTRTQRDGRRGGSAGSSTRSIRSSGASYEANGSSSSRDSRATSPSFTYASLYEPAPAVNDPSQYFPPPSAPGYYMYPQYPPPPPGQVPGQPYLNPYQYYPPYGYPPHQHHSDPTSPSGGEAVYPSHPASHPPMGYVPYMWPPSPSGLLPTHASHPHQQNPHMGSGVPAHTSHPSPPQPQNMTQYSPPMYPPHTQFNPFSPPYPPPQGMFQPGSSMGVPLPTIPSHSPYIGEMTMSASGHLNGNGVGVESNNYSRPSSRSSGSHHSNGGKRGVTNRRNLWNYPPSSNTFNLSGLGSGLGNTETVGPRFNSTARRISGASSGSGSGARTPGDEASSTASSSTTSSSSRQTFTSTSSKHPLPARPDWAVGLKPQPMLHPPRHHDHSGPGSRNMSPARLGGQAHLQPSHQPVLQSTDFPPLSSAPERRAPVVGGAWTNTSSMRSILTPGPQGPANAGGSALVHYPSANPQLPGGAHVDQDLAFERPPPMGAPELFNPKGARLATPKAELPARGEKERDGARARSRGESVASAVLVERIGGMTLDGRGAEVAEGCSEVGQVPAAAAPPMGDAEGADGGSAP